MKMTAKKMQTLFCGLVRHFGTEMHKTIRPTDFIPFFFFVGPTKKLHEQKRLCAKIYLINMTVLAGGCLLSLRCIAIVDICVVNFVNYISVVQKSECNTTTKKTANEICLHVSITSVRFVFYVVINANKHE